MWWWPWGESEQAEGKKKIEEAKPAVVKLNRQSFKRALSVAKAASSNHGEAPEVVDERFVLDLYHVFKRFDRDGDGKISAEELMDVLVDLGASPSMSEVKTMISEFDEDQDGNLDMEEFVKLNVLAAIVPDDVTGEDEIHQLFKVFDHNQNGLICADELFRVIRSTGEPVTLEECLDMIRMADTNGDGHIDVEEFRRLMGKPFHAASS